MRASLGLLLFKAFICALVFVLPVHPDASGLRTKAPHAIVFEWGSKTILFEHDVDAPTPTASMSKLMTLYIVLKNLKAGNIKLEDNLRVSEGAASAGAPTAFLKTGQLISVNDLIKGAAVASGNDACITLAEGLYTSQEKFVEEMNRVAKELDLKNSRFVNVTGWPDDNMMSVRDLLILSARILQDFPEYYYFFGEKQFTYNGITQKNYNALLNYNNIAVDGIKTGHTRTGGYGMVASALKDGRRVLVVINGLSTETERAYEAKKLILYALNHFSTKTIFPANGVVGEISVKHKKGTSLQVFLKEDAVVTYPKDLEHELHAFLLSQESLKAPIKKGQLVGSLLVKTRNSVQYSFPVYAATSVRAPCAVCDYIRSLYRTLYSRYASDD